MYVAQHAAALPPALLFLAVTTLPHLTSLRLNPAGGMRPRNATDSAVHAHREATAPSPKKAAPATPRPSSMPLPGSREKPLLPASIHNPARSAS